MQFSNIPAAQTYSQVLEFFQDKSRFGQGYYNFTKEGEKCGWREGYSFCTIGALCHFTDGMSHKTLCCLQRVSEHLYGCYIQTVNDSEGGYEKVLKALEFAKELWTGYEPTEEELGMSVPKLLEKRNGYGTDD